MHFRHFIIALLVISMATIAVNFFRIFLEPLLILNIDFSKKKYRTVSASEKKSVYVPGAGFSGFFYTLGRLQASTASHEYDESSYEYYCFSAGCLALVTSMMQIPVERALELAHTARDRWIIGDFGRYDVVAYFVDELIFSEDSQNPVLINVLDCEDYFVHEYNSFGETQTSAADFCCLQNTSAKLQPSNHKLLHKLRQINIITTEWTTSLSYSSNVQKPASIDQLKELLIRTTWM